MRFADQLREMRIAAYVREGLPVRMIVNRFGENARPIIQRVQQDSEQPRLAAKAIKDGMAEALFSPRKRSRRGG